MKTVATNRLRRNARSVAGFTLVELMVVIGIIAIAIGLALPDLASFFRRSNISSVTNEWLSGINFARVEAIKRNAPVVMCPSNDGTNCASTGGAWDNGYIVFVDANADGARQPANAAEELLRAISIINSSTTIQSSGSSSLVRFAPNGLMWGGAAGMRFAISDSKVTKSEEVRYICIARAGRATAMDFKTFANDPRFAGCK